jgi:cytochrome b
MTSTAPSTTLPATAGPARAAATRGRRVIDAPIRMFHWLFALGFVGAYVTADSEHWRLLHVTLGYSVAGLLAFRVLYGLVGPRQARLAALWHRVAGFPAWARAALSGTPKWGQAQGLFMGAAIVLLLAAVVPLTLSGMGTYQEWSAGDWLEEVHEFFGNAMLALVLGHLGLLLLLSVLRRRNQAMPMITGRVPGNGPDLVRSNRAWLAAVLLLAVLGYGAWEWQQSPNGLLAGDSARMESHEDDD